VTTLSSTTIEARCSALVAQMRDDAIDRLVVGPGSDLRYLTGYDAPALERPTLLVVDVERPPLLLLPELEVLRARAHLAPGVVELHPYREGADPFEVLARARPVAPGRTIALGDQLWSAFALALQERAPGGRWVAGSPVMAGLRSRKDPTEIAALAAVGAAIDHVHAQVASHLVPGRSEREVARVLDGLIRTTHDAVSFVIVAAGPNAASPHHEPGERLLERGDAVVVDIGGTLDGYCSDMTRTYHLGPPSARFAAAYDALEQAQAAATAAVVPGATTGDIDAAARTILTDAGLGPAFVHRTGHGIGLDTHEAPWIVEGGTTVLEPGMTFSIEPGFYLEGLTGARIEDIVAVTASGVRPLNLRPRALEVV